MGRNNSGEKTRAKKLVHKYILEIRDENTFEEKLSWRLSRLNVLFFTLIAVSIIVGLIMFLLNFTPLKEYVLGYTYVNMKRELMTSNTKVDSLGRELQVNLQYLENIKAVLSGDVLTQRTLSVGKAKLDSAKNNRDEEFVAEQLELKHSKADSLLREEIESESRFNFILDDSKGFGVSSDNLADMLFFNPIVGMLTDSFSYKNGHFGVDIVAPQNEAVKATLDGTVIVANYTSETGFVLAIQHKQNLLSFYKHNSVLLKKVGNRVSAGEVISIIGSSGELSTGPHLHFELWHNGHPINPVEYMVF